MGNDKIFVSRESCGWGHCTWKVSGLTEEELAYVEQGTGLSESRDRFMKVMEDHGSGYGKCLAYGYGIYSVKRHGDVLLVETGANCD